MPTNESTEVVYDEHGFDENGVHRDTHACFDQNGFDWEGIHEATGTEFHPSSHRTRDGSRYNDEGYDWRGYDSDGYDCEGYGEDGYNADGEDSNGNTRCENGDCEDLDCSCHRSDFEGCLRDYGEKAISVCGWRCPPSDRTLYAGHEFEMYSDDTDSADVDFVLNQLDCEYRKHAPMTRYGKCAIAKYDGSLEVSEGGFEVSTVPLTREQTYGIFTAFKTLGNGSCSAWDRGDDVGHHIHVSKSAITALTLGKLGVFMNCPENRRFIEMIACRRADYNGFENNKKLTSLENFERHSVLNVTDSTVEFRLFKSNLYSKAILKNYEFAVAAVRFCEQAGHGLGLTLEPTSPLHWTQFRRYVAANRSEYAFLHQFLIAHPQIGNGYRTDAGLPVNVARPKEKSPVFALLRTTSVVGA